MRSSVSIAVHEAGHAVVGTKLGFAVEWITIVPTNEYAGFCKFKREPRPRRQWAVVSLAGNVAEQELLSTNNGLGNGDMHALVKCRCPVGMSRRGARKLVKLNEAAIWRVASALLDKGTIQREEIEVEIARV